MEETILGIQSNGVQASAKHFIAYEQEVSYFVTLLANILIYHFCDANITFADTTKPNIR